MITSRYSSSTMTPPLSTQSVLHVPKPGFSHKHLLLAFLAGILIVLFGYLVYIICFKRRSPRVLRQRWLIRRGELKSNRVLDLRRFQLEELEKATKNFSEDCLIGSGAFGKVYKGTFDDERTLAIKKAHDDSFQTVHEFRNEVELISRVKHRNLLGLVGYCEETGAKGTKALVYEYVPNGSLIEYIVGRGGKILTWRQRVNIAIGAAKGIAYLHEGIKPSIIHRDIKPSNILVGAGFEAKVSDFGLVKSGPVGDQSHVSSLVKGTPGYLDPAYCTSLHLTPFSDVYSFGVILLQLVAARPAVDTSRNGSRFHITDWARPSIEGGNVEDIIDVNLLTDEACNMEMMLKMGQLGLRCVVKLPKDRPTMTQIWQELEETLHNWIDDDHDDHKQPSREFDGGGSSLLLRSMGGGGGGGGGGVLSSSVVSSTDSMMSIDGIGLQRFHVEMDSYSFLESTSLRCLENNSLISIDINVDDII